MSTARRSSAQEQDDSMVGISDICRLCGKHVKRSEGQVVSGDTTAHWLCVQQAQDAASGIGPEGF